MCFRPADVTAVQTCPHCGKSLPMKEGIKLKKCPFCKTPFDDLPMNTMAPAAPSAPDGSRSPGVPNAPKAPGAPGVPKTPVMPSVPKSE